MTKDHFTLSDQTLRPGLLEDEMRVYASSILSNIAQPLK